MPPSGLFGKRDEVPPCRADRCHWPLSTGILEGINNMIKVIKRMAYRFRDDEYFFLKIRAAFPGIQR
jgi:transposase